MSRQAIVKAREHAEAMVQIERSRVRDILKYGGPIGENERIHMLQQAAKAALAWDLVVRIANEEEPRL